MIDDYLMKEYELCFEQLRFYDSRYSEMSKYLFTLTSAVATAQFAVFKFLQSATPAFFACQTVLSFIVFVATVLLYLAMLQNRLYFVFMARQINAIRGYLMATAAPDFKANQLYTCVDFPAFRFRSLHTAHLIGAALISSVFAGIGSYGLLSALSSPHAVSLGLAVFAIVVIFEIVGGTVYLLVSGKKTANEFLRSEKTEP